MVPSALGSEVALVGRAVGPGHGMVRVAVDGLGVAAGGVAGFGAGAEQVLELAAGGVVGFGVAVVALAAGDGLGGELQLGEEVMEPGSLGGVGGFAGARGWSGPGSGGRRDPGVLAGGAGVGAGGAVGVDDRGAPAGSWVL